MVSPSFLFALVDYTTPSAVWAKDIQRNEFITGIHKKQESETNPAIRVQSTLAGKGYKKSAFRHTFG